MEVQADSPPRYQEWIDFYFHREFSSPHALGWDFDAEREVKAELFVATLRRSGSDLMECTDQQIATGLKAIWLGDLSNSAYDICETSDSSKAAVVRSFVPLYADLLSRRSPAVLGHLNEGTNSELGYVTYMAWDVSPMRGLIGMQDESGHRSLLVDVLIEVLCVKPANVTIIESVLHGLGHMVCAHPKYRSQIVTGIDFFLGHCPIARPELKTYAENAKRGYVQ